MRHADIGDLSSVDHRCDDTTERVDAEPARLEAEIAVARHRLTAAQQRIDGLDVDPQAALRAEVATFGAILAEMERRHGEEVAAVREAAQAEVERILAEVPVMLTGPVVGGISPEKSRTADAG